MSISEIANKNIQDILDFAVEHTPNHRAVVVFDLQSDLSRLITEAYRAALPEATFIDFNQTQPAEILAVCDALAPRDLVVLIQSGNFRLSEFRIRIELFKRQLKVIEHPHLDRMLGAEAEVYVNSLAYNEQYYRPIGHALKQRIDSASHAKVISGDCELVYTSPFESAKLNIGDYTGMTNIGGQFPIGEVFTEPSDLDGVNGKVQIFAFGDTSFRVNIPAAPITLVIAKGQVVGVGNATPDFEAVLEQIKTDEKVWVRELGFGMNQAFSRDCVVSDIGSYERMCGMHLSLGAKHTIYNKPDFKRKVGKHHVDVFVVTDRVEVGGEVVFEKGQGYTVGRA